MIIRILLSLLLLTVASIAIADSLTGQVDRVNDGDTFKIWGQSIRLIGIDAPENSQPCKDNVGQDYQCGDSATNFLKELVRGQEVTCEGAERDDYDRLLAVCYIGETEINKAMVESGWAVAYIKYDARYAAQENIAKKEGKGIWQGNFIRPHQFRSGSWMAEEINTGKECLIKGNINSKDDRIYHTPWGSNHYKRTRINTNKGERWFCTEAEALAAGWRAPYR